MDRKLYLSETNKMLAGVCGGIGEFFAMDPTIVRLLWAILSLLSGGIGGILIYLAFWIIVPRNQ